MKHLILMLVVCSEKPYTVTTIKLAACTYDMLGCISLSEVRML
ncbi:MAG: hypothetical protein ACLTJ5_06745 [Clostridium sp.]